MLQYQLFQEQKSPLVLDFLSDLHHRSPGILCRELRTIRTLPILHQILDLKRLFEDSRCKNFFLYR